MTDDKRKVRGNIAKDKILDTAICIIANEGIQGLSTGKISSISGISKGNIFHHFKSVDDIYKESFARLLSQMTSPQVNKSTTLEVFFKELGKAAFVQEENEILGYKALLAFYNTAQYSETYKDKILELKRSFQTYMIDAINKITNIKVSNELAELISVDLDGLGLYYLLEMDIVKYRNLWDIKSNMYINLINEQKS